MFTNKIKHTIEIIPVIKDKEYTIRHSILYNQGNMYGYDSYTTIGVNDINFVGEYDRAQIKAWQLQTEIMYANIDFILPEAEQKSVLAKHTAETKNVQSMIKQVKDTKKGTKNGMK